MCIRDRNYLVSKGYSQQLLYDANILRSTVKNGKRYYYDAFKNRAMYPVIDLRGNVIAVSYTHLDVYKRQALFRA